MDCAEAGADSREQASGLITRITGWVCPIPTGNSPSASRRPPEGAPPDPAGRIASANRPAPTGARSRDGRRAAASLDVAPGCKATRATEAAPLGVRCGTSRRLRALNRAPRFCPRLDLPHRGAVEPAALLAAVPLVASITVEPAASAAEQPVASVTAEPPVASVAAHPVASAAEPVASAAAGPVGRHASAGTSWKLDTEILTYSRAKGAFAGIALDGASVRQDVDSTRAIYGKKITTRTALMGQVAAPRAAQAFLDAVRGAKAQAIAKAD